MTTKGKEFMMCWTKGDGAHLWIKDKHIADFDEVIAAKICASAYNQCISINPDNPQAVAEGIKEMYEALKAAQEGTGDWRAMVDLVLAKVDGK